MNLVNYVATSGTFFNMLIFHHWFLGKLKSLSSISMASLKLNKQSKAVKSTKEINISSKEEKTLAYARATIAVNISSQDLIL